MKIKLNGIGYKKIEDNLFYAEMINPEKTISQVIEEIAQMIEQKEHMKVMGDIRNLMLCNRYTNEILNPGISLRENEVKSGYSLMLV